MKAMQPARAVGDDLPSGLGNLLGSFDLSLKQRGSLLDLDRQLHAQWGLGRNLILGWHSTGSSILALVVPHYAIAEYALAAGTDSSASRQCFVAELLTGSRRFSARQLDNAARLLGSQPITLALRHPLPASEGMLELIDRMVRRYGVSHVPRRAVALFDIVGFSLLRPFERMTQLNSLSHSLNSAHSKMLGSSLRVDFAHSSTGDGFYIWNREEGIEASANLYHLMHLVLADNAIARRKACDRATVPTLRACFHVGSCYEFHHAEGLSPSLHTQIVGDVTIELARMVDRALPGQILVGDFELQLSPDGPAQGVMTCLDSIAFIDHARDRLLNLNGLELAGEAVESIRCYLTGHARKDGSFTVRRLALSDKHGLTHSAFNAKVNIYRRSAEPILLGIEDRHLRDGQTALRTAEHIYRPVNPH